MKTVGHFLSYAIASINLHRETGGVVVLLASEDREPEPIEILVTPDDIAALIEHFHRIKEEEING